MTEREGQVLRFIVDYIDEHGWAPSYREIQEAVSIPSKQTVQKILFSLESQGRIRVGHAPRGAGARMIALA